jgi:hypothetical protein
MARAASKRGQTNTVSVNTTKTENNSRSVTTNARKSEASQTKNSRTAVKPTEQRVVGRTPAQKQTVKQRSATAQPYTKQPEVKKRVSTVSRTGSTRVVDVRDFDAGKLKTTRSATKTATKSSKKNARAAELNTEKISNIKTKDYSKCKTVYFECMDEFCANKDTNLRRCACSSRIHEFDNIKKQLSDAEDKMLDFNQRLLTVSLDKEDAAAINIASEGEIAYDKKDQTESEKLLQKITNTLNNSGDSRLNNNLSAISLTLDMDTAWDSVDSLSGVATTAKSGLDLYNAAQPVCIEMAQEVCSDDELDIAKSSYTLTIQQDCNTVAKSYDTLYNQAQEKIYESGALLDMARLNTYQQRNSDDILTCKKKILTQLSDATVCGENLYKCLDLTGQYINPSNGQAFLSDRLYALTELLQEPNEDEKWSTISHNEKFVQFLNDKKEFLEPATEQCQDVADLVWKDFLDDALSQIKLAQNAKIEEIRQSCTTLVAECKTKSLDDLSEFDARALSTFNVLSDKTANAMCEKVENSCTALMNNIDVSNNWEQGVAGISAGITYDNIIDSCMQIGRDCIIQQCNGTAGNFALCQKSSDDKRIAILTRDACWNNVYDCVKDADKISNIRSGILPSETIDENDRTYNNYSPARTNYYNSLYAGISMTDVPVFCSGKSGDDLIACLITEQMWGNCEYNPTEYSIISNETIVDSYSDKYNTHNKILVPSSGSTLLSWFASNTGTTNNKDSCNAKGCPLNYELTSDGNCKEIPSNCLNSGLNVIGTNECITDRNKIINVDSDLLNYCESGVIDAYGNCCGSDTIKVDGICVPSEYKSAQILQTLTCSSNEASTDTSYLYYCPIKNIARTIAVYCVSRNTNSGLLYIDDTDTRYVCENGFWLLIDEYGNYFNLQGDQDESSKSNMSFTTASGNACTYTNGSWTPTSCGTYGSIPTTNNFIIKFN